MNKRNLVRRFLMILAGALCVFALSARAQIVFSEIMYHPVEEPSFNADGSPVLDLYEDVHEFVEILNAGTNTVDLTGWKITGGIRFTFPRGATIRAGEYRVVAKNPERLAMVAAYGLSLSNLFGPYTGQLSNSKDTLRIENGAGDTKDAVSYSAEFPWAISADALGANEDFTGINPLQYQYRGRSLERVSFTHAANDPANWLASPLPGNPSPGKPNAVSLPAPKPIVVGFHVAQESDGSAIIRSNQPVRIRCVLSAATSLSDLSVEWFVDDINVSDEPRGTAAMQADGPSSASSFSAILPGLPNRSVVRFRFHANRGNGDEVISPRADDPYSWHAYFVSPVRVSTKPIYDCFISANSLTILNRNVSQSPRRVTTPDPPGMPRAAWNATEPAIVVFEGVVYDARMRHHGSRYNRRASRNSFKWQFPRYKKFNGVTGIFETDKGNDFIVGQNLFIQAGLPDSNVRYVDLYLNNTAVLQRLEQGEFDGDMLDAYHQSQQALNPGTVLEPSGEIYKSVGTIDMNGEGPYGRGDGRKLVKPGYWTDLQMYDWTYALQNNGWRGSYNFKQMIDAMWAARGDTPSAPNPNIPALRAFFEKYFDIDEMLDYIAIENWVCPWDDTTQNHFLWQKRNGKWGMLPWDCDAWFGRGDNTPASSSIYIGEVGDRNNNSRGPNFFKDGFIKTFREEYKKRLYILNNTFLHPDNITAMGFGSIRTFANARFAAVNSQCGFGPFERPAKPANVSPANNGVALTPAVLETSIYKHSAISPPPHAKTTWEIRRASGTYRAPLWKVTSATNLTSIAIPFEQLVYGETYYWRSTHFDTDDHPSFVSDETSFTFGTSTASSMGNVVLNEIAARHRNVAGGAEDSDWIELFNKGAEPLDLSGMSLSDDMLVPGKYIFPAKTVIPAQSYLTVWCDHRTNAPGLHTGFRLNDSGQTVALFSAGKVAVVDSVTFGSQIDDFTIGRIPNGTGGWQLTVATLAQANQPATLGAATGLKINEWMGTPAAGDDWFELFNPASQPVELSGLYLTDSASDPANTLIPPLSFVGPGGFTDFIADQKPESGANHVNFKLSANGESIYLFSTNGTIIIDAVTFGPQGAGVSQGRLPDGGGTIVPFPMTASRGESNHLPIGSVVINEVLAHSDPPLEDAIELHNRSVSPIDITGWFLSDDLSHLKKFRIPDGTIIPAGGYKVFYEYQFNADTNSSASFALNSAEGDDVYLSVADAGGNLTGYRTHVDFGPSANGVSFGRVETSGGADFTALSRRTFGVDSPTSLAEFRGGTGAANASVSVGPIVISEIMYHPPDLDAADNTRDEFIELHNITPGPVALFDPASATNTWRLRDGVDFDFPLNVVMPSRSYLLLVSFDPATNTTARVAFQLKYGTNVPLLGPYQGKLDNGGESVKLYRPDPPQTIAGPSFGFVPYILTDAVKYSDTAPWPVAADGTGASLQRINAAAYGNEPANWMASGFTPGTAIPGSQPEPDSDRDGMPDVWETAHGLQVGVNDAALDMDGDGMTNLQEYLADTDPQKATSALSLEALKIGSDLGLRFVAQANKTYIVQFRSNLFAGAWQSYTNIGAQPNSRTIQLSNPAGSSETSGYFRVLIPAP